MDELKTEILRLHGVIRERDRDIKELLAALKIAERWSPTDASWEAKVDLVRAVIAKAEDEQ
jgi:hypothetical protein